MNLLEAAMRYHGLGYSLIPVAYKKPVVAWASFTESRPAATQINQWFSNETVTGIGLISGAVSRNLVIIDLDGDAAIEAYRDRFPALWETYRVKSGSGMHCYYQPHELPPTTRGTLLMNGTIKEIGLRANGCYTVAPPSLHPSGARYLPENRVPIMRPLSLMHVSKWIYELIQAKKKTQPNPPAAPAMPTRPGVYNRAYVRGAVRNAERYVASAPQGERNNRLYAASVNLGSLIGEHLTISEIESVLLSAAMGLAKEDGYGAVMATIRNGIKRGLNNPYELPR